jgi:hypothetical protein
MSYSPFPAVVPIAHEAESNSTPSKLLFYDGRKGFQSSLLQQPI